MRTTILFAFALAVVACNKSSTPPANPPAENPPAGDETPAQPSDEGAQRPGITAADCEGQGGKVVGDIGDGAVHRPEYRCESGQPPVGTITSEPGGPQAIEGAVCCK